jgi:hypothetical protein
MSKYMRHNGETLSIPNCANCIHTFRWKELHDVVVCVLHLTTMPAGHTQVCEQYARKNRSSLTF